MICIFYGLIYKPTILINNGSLYLSIIFVNYDNSLVKLFLSIAFFSILSLFSTKNGIL